MTCEYKPPFIYQSDPRATYLSHKEEIDWAVGQVLSSGRYILGNEVTSFEKEFANFIGVAYAIGVGSGTDALHLALRALGIRSGDEVITVSHTAVATVAAIELCGATPVLVDIEPHYFTLDAHKMEKAISSRTKAVIPVHLYGQPADLDDICTIAGNAQIYVIEDCAQAHGAQYKDHRVGSLGDVSCFSFYPTKNLGGFGDGGMIVTNRSDLAEKIRILREYGWGSRHISEIAGMNSRLDEIQAAILRVKLRYLEQENEARRCIAARYNRGLHRSSVITPRIRTGVKHVYHQYVIRSKSRRELQDFLKARGIGSLIHYPLPIHLQPAYIGRMGNEGYFPNTERITHEILSLPMHPFLTDEQIFDVIDAVISFRN